MHFVNNVVHPAEAHNVDHSTSAYAVHHPTATLTRYGDLHLTSRSRLSVGLAPDNLLRLQASSLGASLRNCAVGLAAAATLCLPMSMMPSPVRLRAHLDHSKERVMPDSAT